MLKPQPWAYTPALEDWVKKLINYKLPEKRQNIISKWKNTPEYNSRLGIEVAKTFYKFIMPTPLITIFYGNVK